MRDPTKKPLRDPTIPKPLLLSKTVVLNTLMTAAGVAFFLSSPKNDPTLTVASLSAAAGGIVNVVLRVWFTAAPIIGTPLADQAMEARAVAIAGAVDTGVRAVAA